MQTEAQLLKNLTYLRIGRLNLRVEAACLQVSQVDGLAIADVRVPSVGQHGGALLQIDCIPRDSSNISVCCGTFQKLNEMLAVPPERVEPGYSWNGLTAVHGLLLVPVDHQHTGLCSLDS